MKEWIAEKRKKVDLSSPFKRYTALIGFCSLLLLTLLAGSLNFLFKVKSLDQKLSELTVITEKKSLSLDRKKKLEELSKKNPSLQFFHQLSSEVQNVHHRKELTLISQFQGFELLKGHQSKVILDALPHEEWAFVEVASQFVDGFKETEYKLLESPVLLSDEELKSLILFLEDKKKPKPSFIVKEFSFAKEKGINGREVYQTTLSLIIREKPAVNSASRI
jgi:hypothetical protein